jgi:hypothetical protein
MANEQPPLATHGRRPDIVLHQVVVDLEASIRQIPFQGLILIEELADGFAQAALG